MSVATATLLSGGKAIDPAWGLLSLAVRREVNRLPSASLTLIAGGDPGSWFAVSEAAAFQPGAEIEVKLRYEGEPNSERTVFKGLVVRHGIRAGGSGPCLEVELKDAAVKLTQARQLRVFRKMRDDEVIAKILKEAGLPAGSLHATPTQHEELVQYESTDWDFMGARADANGCVLVVHDGQVSLKPLDLQGAPKYHFEYGLDSVFNLEMELDGSRQYPAVQSLGWDPKEQALTPPSKARSFSIAQGNVDGAKLARTLGFGDVTLRHPAPIPPKELQAWADGRLARSRMSLLRGRLAVPGFATLDLLDVIELKGVGNRFNGNTLVTGFAHQVNQDGWQTDVQFGLPPRWFSEAAGLHDAPAAGLLPGARGLQLGIVSQIHEDPEKEVRVQLMLVGMAEKAAVWARWAAPHAGAGRGLFFLPEIGDEVVVGFCNGDPRQPIILGALYSSKNKLPSDFDGYDQKNLKKGLVTRGGTKLTFVDEEKPSVFIETPGGNKVLLDDDQKLIKLTDQHGNVVTMDEHGITLKSAKDLQLEASGNVTIKGAKVDVQ